MNDEQHKSNPAAPAAERPDQGQRLRSATDTGETGDKVAFPDPAAAPLGTDDEAAGQIATGGAPPPVHTSRANETGGAGVFRSMTGEVWMSNQRLFGLLALGTLVGAVLVTVLSLL